VLQYEAKGYVVGVTDKIGNWPANISYIVTMKKKEVVKEGRLKYLSAERICDFNAIVINLTLTDENLTCIRNMKNSIQHSKIR